MSGLILSKMADFEECDRIASIVDANQVAAENSVPIRIRHLILVNFLKEQ